jgi:hypothetical protein
MNNDTVQCLIKCLGEPDAVFARKALNYYDGKQTEEILKSLSAPNNFRKNWKEKGLTPRTRNITKAIVDKSGLLFNGNQPRVEVWTGGAINQVASQNLKDILDSIDWIEFFTNFDNQVRLLKTGLVLVQLDPINKKPILDGLHRGNSAVCIDPVTRQVTDLLMLTCDDDSDEYRYFTLDTIYDLEYEEDAKELVIKAQFPNPYGIIPVASFHDTSTPRYGMWNIAPTDIVGMNEMYNFHLMDSEYAAAWSKVKTLFTNAEIGDSSAGTQTWVDPTTGIPRQVPAQPSTVGGPGRIVMLETGPGETPYVEYKGPDVTLMPIEEMFSQWVKDFAGDWSVRLQASGDAGATSGFQLIVEELPNMELRKQRQKMFTAGFARLYKVLTFVLNGIPGIALPQDGILYVTFADPELPVDDMDQENVWSKRIMEGRASRVDYFMETEGMTKDEALAKIAEIDLYNAPMATPNMTLTRNTAVRIA